MPERRRIINSDTLEEGLAAEAKRLRKEAEKLKPDQSERHFSAWRDRQRQARI